MAVITIDGKKLEVPDNKNVLECALDAGIYIPHLCHHKRPESVRIMPYVYCRSKRTGWSNGIMYA